jgi:hypothetical protein
MYTVFEQGLECLDREDLKRERKRHTEAEDQEKISRADAGKLQRQNKGKKIKDDQYARRIYRATAQNIQKLIHSGAPLAINAHILAYFRAHCKY